MEYTEELTLITKIKSQDNIGQVVEVETSTTVFAKKNVVGSKEFYNAVAVGIKPTAELQIRLSNYNNETEVIYNNIHYSVIRTIPKGKYDIVLVLGVKTGVK